ncbi:acyl-CoA dehydrogenase family protein [Jongsikchunia kroppenstedtii]|uniref:acyl-CoA dehydrogenase family protein n=1 Tax=Jongsikchunia kroppenstedtii TaxID=1121721 RepID=UPI00035CCA4A|nr:acyl-CoA dehydrogenase family protein [Jongsikchunia kroppenstedtii]
MSGDLLGDTADRIFADWSEHADPWRVAEDAGLTRIGIGEEAGGSGGGLAEAAEVLRWSGFHALAAPVAETLWLAGPLLAAARLPIPDGPLTAAWADAGQVRLVADGGGAWSLDGEFSRVPWARDVVRIVVVVGDRLCSIAPDACEIIPGADLVGDPRDTVRCNQIRIDADDVVDLPVQPDMQLRAALARTVQITGAAQRAVDLSVRYAGERVQFGRKLAAFQAVQQYLATMAEEAAVAELASISAVRAYEGDAEAGAAVAAARINAIRAAGVIAELAHQVHGAIGTTEEHPLHRATLRLWAWSAEHGNAQAWARRLGERAGSVSDPWEFLTGF